MTAPTALDRAARALLANMAATGTSVTITLDAANLEAVDINGCFDARAMVRAVLAALAEPTPGMVEAGAEAMARSTIGEPDWALVGRSVPPIWRAMIAAAQKVK